MNAMQALELVDFAVASAPEPNTSVLGGEISDGQANTLYATAYQYADRGQHDKASVLFAVLGMFRPHDSRFAQAAGVCYRKLGQYQDALAMFGRALQLEPGNLAPAFQVVDCLLLLGRRDEAQGLLKAMLEMLRQDDPEASDASTERIEAMLGFIEGAVQ